MTKEEMEKYTTLDINQCKWWVNHLFNIAKEKAFNANVMDDAKEIESAQEKIIKVLEREPKWIPVSERLPKLGQEVLCYCQAKIYDVLRYTKDGWFKDTEHCYMDGFVIAWMPLPEPYKEGPKDGTESR